MAQSHVSCLMHIVFSTEDRRRDITPELQEKLWPYLGGIARNLGAKALVVGGADDHVHMLLSLPSTITISSAVQKIKASSSKWINETRPERMKFGWQKGYGAFSISVSAIDSTIRYIENQAEHHKRKSFKEEIEEFLKAHGFKFWVHDPAFRRGTQFGCLRQPIIMSPCRSCPRIFLPSFQDLIAFGDVFPSTHVLRYSLASQRDFCNDRPNDYDG